MRSLSLMFLITIISTKPFVHALNCHICAAEGKDCFNPFQCPELAIYCKTVWTYSPEKVHKSCVTSCTKDDLGTTQLKQNAKVSCCQADLCNGAASQNFGVSELVLTGLLSIFWSLFALGL